MKTVLRITWIDKDTSKVTPYAWTQSNGVLIIREKKDGDVLYIPLTSIMYWTVTEEEE